MGNKKNKIFIDGQLFLEKEAKWIKVYRALLEKAQRQAEDKFWIKQNGDWRPTGNFCTYGSISFSKELGMKRDALRPVIETLIHSGVISRIYNVDPVHSNRNGSYTDITYSNISIEMRFENNTDLVEHIRRFQREHGSIRSKGQSIQSASTLHHGVNDTITDDPDSTLHHGVNIHNDGNEAVFDFSEGCLQPSMCVNEERSDEFTHCDSSHSILSIGVKLQAGFTPPPLEELPNTRSELAIYIKALVEHYLSLPSESPSDDRFWVLIHNSVPSYNSTIEVLQEAIIEREREERQRKLDQRKMELRLRERSTKNRKPKNPAKRTKPKVIDEYDPMTSIYLQIRGNAS